jgi:hypothetical protein
MLSPSIAAVVLAFVSAIVHALGLLALLYSAPCTNLCYMPASAGVPGKPRWG